MLTRLALLLLAAGCLWPATVSAADRNADQTRKLVAVLQSDAAFYDKARACQQLGEFGDRQAIPALAALLADEHLAAYARSGLEGIPDPGAAQALRAAAATLKGNLLVGVVNSLGVLRDPQAVLVLRKLADDPASGATRPALLALGCIATQEAIEILRPALAGGTDARRADAATACLLAAGQQLADGRPEAAAALYDSVRNANVPPLSRAAATRGAIVARQENGVPLLVEQLKSPERLLRQAALTAIREIPSDALAKALNEALDQAPPELQSQILTALVDCHNQQSLQVLQRQAASEDADVRKTALQVLGRIGGAPEAAVLLRAAANPRAAEEAAVAWNSLKLMEGAGVDAQIVLALAATDDAAQRVQLLRLLESRGATNATAALFKAAADVDPRVSAAALRALQSLAGAGDLPTLLALVRVAREEPVREAAENAVVGLCRRTGNTGPGSEAVLTLLKPAADPGTKNSCIRMLAALGEAQALPAILAACREANESVAANAVEQLARWPDPAPVDELLVMVQTGASPAVRQSALASAIRLTTGAAEERQRPAATLVEWLQKANQAATTTQERRLIISGLGYVSDPASLRLLVPFLSDQELQGEASVAIVQLAPGLRQSDPAALREALERIATGSGKPEMRAKARELANSLPSAPK